MTQIEVMIPYMENGRLKVEYFKCESLAAFQKKLLEFARKEDKYEQMIDNDPMCRVKEDYILTWDGISLSDVLAWASDDVSRIT